MCYNEYMKKLVILKYNILKKNRKERKYYFLLNKLPDDLDVLFPTSLKTLNLS